MGKIAIMQPYIFPYIGYFQLINAVDEFVFLNDVNFIKKGWINRNRILVNGKESLLTIPCAAISQNRAINETKVALDAKTRQQLLDTVKMGYHRAPYFVDVYPVVEQALMYNCTFIDELAIHSVRLVCSFMGVGTETKESGSDFSENRDLKREARLIDICKREGINEYINPIGGTELYTKSQFMQEGIKLDFIKSKPVAYKQFDNEFVPWLSIIDVLMFNGRNATRTFLDEYELV